MSPWKTPGYLERLKQFSNVLGTLYYAIQKVSGSRVIVDSSKTASYAYLLRSIPNIDLYVIHLVRDSRGAAYSWLRKKTRPDIQGETEIKVQTNPLRSSGAWLVRNILVEGLKYYPDAKYRLIRYEDFIDYPDEVISSISNFVQEDAGAAPIMKDRLLSLKPNHTAAGNIWVRFESGTVKLRRDDEWKTKMKVTQRGLVTLLTWPLLLKYGYFSGNAEGESVKNK
jgi:hypothetical protein